MRNTIFSYKSDLKNSFLALFMWSEVKVKVKCHISAAATADLVSGAFVCRHREGSWNAVSSDQFGEQTAIKIGKGGLKGITLGQKTVTEWLSAFPIGAYICDTVASTFSIKKTNQMKGRCFIKRRGSADVILMLMIGVK